MCTTGLHGGVCHRTSTPHKSGIKMKKKSPDCCRCHAQQVTHLGTQNGTTISYYNIVHFRDSRYTNLFLTPVCMCINIGSIELLLSQLCEMCCCLVAQKQKQDENKYGFCVIDGNKEKIGNFRIEPWNTVQKVAVCTT